MRHHGQGPKGRDDVHIGLWKEKEFARFWAPFDVFSHDDAGASCLYYTMGSWPFILPIAPLSAPTYDGTAQAIMTTFYPDTLVRQPRWFSWCITLSIVHKPDPISTTKNSKRKEVKENNTTPCAQTSYTTPTNQTNNTNLQHHSHPKPAKRRHLLTLLKPHYWPSSPSILAIHLFICAYFSSNVRCNRSHAAHMGSCLLQYV